MSTHEQSYTDIPASTPTGLSDLRAPARSAWLRVSAALRAVKVQLAALPALAGTLNLWALSRNGYANEYYSAAVRSMSTSWHNFLFAAMDPSGVMTVDKPPLALWIQALSVRVFGYHPLSILVPQALMGMASVALVYDLVRRRFGRLGGFIAGLALALTPISVAISRHNNPDALLVLCVVAALWCAVRALEPVRAEHPEHPGDAQRPDRAPRAGHTGQADRVKHAERAEHPDHSTRWLVLAGVCIGLGFETKMGVALMAVPGIAAAWLWVAPRGRGRGRALRQLMYAGGAMVLVGGAWPALVELTPASARPWISGTSNNTVWQLITEYNGAGRLDGQTGGPAGAGGGGNMFGGTPGPLRLINEALGGQAGWLLGIALLGGVAVLLASRLRRRDPRSGWLIAVGGTFVVVAIVFSAARGIFHPYYVSLLAPPAAALTGAGVAQLRGGGRLMRVLAPLAIAAGVACELAVLHDYAGELSWLVPVLILLGAGAAVALATFADRGIRTAALGLGVAALLIAPAIWAVDTLGYATNGTFPSGGSQSALTGGRGGFGPGGGGGGFRPGGFGPGGLARGGTGGRRGLSSGVQGSGASTRAGGVPLFGSGARGGESAGGGEGPPSVPTSATGATSAGAGAGAGAGAAASAGSPGVPPGAAGGGAGIAGGAGGPGAGFGPGGSGGPGGGGGGAIGAPLGNADTIAQAIAYAKSHGGGTVAVESQSSAATEIVAKDADVAGIGGFSGRESDVSVSWLAGEIARGQIRWVLSEGGATGGPRLPGDTRQGSRKAIEAVTRACKRVTLSSASSSASVAASAASASAATTPTGTASSGAASTTGAAGVAVSGKAGASTTAGTSETALYDCAGRASALLGTQQSHA